MKKSIRLTLMGVLLFVGACSFKKANTDPKEPGVIETISTEQEKQAAEGILTTGNVKVEFEETQDANVYKMKITWPSGIRKVQINVNDKNEKFVLQKDLYEEIVQDDYDFDIRLKSLDQFGAPISSLQIFAKSPRDIVIKKDWNLKEETNVEANRLYISAGSKIITNSFSLNIQANKIFIEPSSDDADMTQWWRTAHILTTIPNTVASEERELLGSNITVRAKEAHGHLRVALIGMSGKDGKSGDQILLERGISTETRDPSLNGANGSNGELGNQTHVFCAFNQDFPCPEPTDTCSPEPTAGRPGQTGASGISGENGWPGGNTGNLTVNVENSQAFNISVGKLRGKAGTGGPGSTGFIGGAGGQPGSGPAPCRTAAAGSEGARGSAGPNGVDGVQSNGETIYLGPIKSEIIDL